MPTRRELLRTGTAFALAGRLRDLTADGSALSPGDLGYLESLARSTIERATSQESVAAVGFPVVTPGGSYPSLWTRDFSMAIGTGLIPAHTIHKHLRHIASVQNGPSDRVLGSRATIPAYAIPDHIRYDGKPVFYPGTYSPDDDQGGEPYGVLPPADDHYEFIHIAHTLLNMGTDGGFLLEDIRGLPLFERLKQALDVPALDPGTGLVETAPSTRAVGFGFCDGVYLTGKLAFASLLRYRALGEMIDLMRSIERMKYVAEWQRQRHLIETHLTPSFMKDGWLIAATGVGRQPDVWATAFALHLGVVRGRAREVSEAALAGAVRKGTISYRGALRHVPTDHDFSATSAWERTAGIAKNRYQNGAYWHVPTGWLASALWRKDRDLARSILGEMITHFRSEAPTGAPWECIHPDGEYRQNPVYMASVTLPLEVVRALR